MRIHRAGFCRSIKVPFEHQDGHFDDFCSIPIPHDAVRLRGSGTYVPKRSQGAGLRQRLISSLNPSLKLKHRD